MRRWILALVIASIALPAGALALDDDVRAASWHQFRGPTGNGTAPQADPPTRWSATENVKWKVAIPGKGASTPIVWGDRIFVLTAVPTEAPAAEPDPEAEPEGDGGRRGRRGRRGGRGGGRGGGAPSAPYEFVVMCLERASGKVVWKQTAVTEKPHEGMHQTATYASPSPVTDGEHVWVSFGSRGLFCYDLEGTLRWKRDLGDKRMKRSFGEGTSPVLHGDSLVVLWDHEEQSYLYCLDAATGEDRWRVERDEGSTWTTPLIVEHGGITQVITNGTNRARSYDLASGELLWECGGQTANPIPAPVAADGVVYVASGFRGNAVYAIPLDARGDITGSEKVIWSNDELGPYVASPLLYDGLLYLTKERNAILSVLDAKTGKPHYTDRRLEGLDMLYASITGAGGRVYITSRNGTTVVLEHGESFKVLATNSLGEGIDASLVPVGEELFVRGAAHLYCIAEK